MSSISALRGGGEALGEAGGIGCLAFKVVVLVPCALGGFHDKA